MLKKLTAKKWNNSKHETTYAQQISVDCGETSIDDGC